MARLHRAWRLDGLLMKLARGFVVGCIKFYVSILTPGSSPEIPAPIDWTDGTP